MAMAILATAMLAAYQGAIQTLDTDTRSRFEQSAPMLAQQKLSVICQPKRLNPTFQKGQFGAPYEDYHWNARIQPVAGAGIFGERTLWQIDIGISHLSIPGTYTLRAYRKSIFDQRG